MGRAYVNFKNKRLNKSIDYDGGLGKQCVDLFKQYMDEVIWISMKGKPSGNARDIRKNVLKPFSQPMRQQIKWYKDLLQGDVICLLENHIGIFDSMFISGKVIGIKVLDQNGSWKDSGSGLGENAVKVHLYKPEVIKGVWRCKTIFDNLQFERWFIAGQLSAKDSTITQTYADSIRYLKK
jgi:hypothetical protein